MSAAPAIDPEKLDKLAEVAIKVGLRLQPGPGPDDDGAHFGAAVGPPHHRACLQGRCWPRHHHIRRRGSNAGPLPLCPRCKLRPRRELALRRICPRLRQQHCASRHRRRQSHDAGQGGPREGRARQPCDVKSLQAGAARRSSISTSTGPSLPTPAPPGPGWSSPTTPRTSPSANSPMRSLPPRASTSRPHRGLGGTQWQACRTYRLAQRQEFPRPQIYAVRARI